MLMMIVNVIYVLVAVAIIALVLLQQGDGAQAGSGFGGGGSATVFGARGSATFLSKSTKWLGVTFFVVSMGMAVYATKNATRAVDTKDDLGVMEQHAAQKAPVAQIPTAPAQQAPAAAPTAAPAPAPAPATPEPAPKK